jgi:hypothetical protein
MPERAIPGLEKTLSRKMPTSHLQQHVLRRATMTAPWDMENIPQESDAPPKRSPDGY